MASPAGFQVEDVGKDLDTEEPLSVSTANTDLDAPIDFTI